MRRENIREYFLSQAPSEEQKRRMLSGVLEQYEAQSRFAIVPGGPDSNRACADEGDMNMNITMKKKLSRVAVIAAVMVLTTMSAFAAVPELRSWVGEQFGLSAEQEQALSQNGTLQNVEASVSDGARTLTVRQTLADENGMYIIYDVDSADGSAVTVDEDEFRFQVPGAADVFFFSYEQQVLEERADGVTCMAVLTGLEDLSGQQVSLTSCGMTCQWTVAEVAQMTAYDADLWGKDAWTGADYHVTGYSVSPISVKLDLEVLGDLGDAGLPDQVAVEVALADGTVKTIEADGSMGKEAGGERYQMFLLSEIIDADAVQAVYVDGVKIR